MADILSRIARQKPKKILILMYNVLRMSAIRIIHRKKFHASIIQNFHPLTVFMFEGGSISLKNSIFTRKGVSFCGAGGELIVGTSFFNQGCAVMARKKIVIGDNCLFGPNVIIVDHDHDYTCQDNQRGAKYICKEVVIGNNVVVGANTVILKGSNVGDNCMIGAGSIVCGNIPAGTLYYMEKTAIAKEIKFSKNFL